MAASILLPLVIIKKRKKYIIIIVEIKPRLVFNTTDNKPEAEDLIEFSVSSEIRLKCNFCCKAWSASFIEFVIKSVLDNTALILLYSKLISAATGKRIRKKEMRITRTAVILLLQPFFFISQEANDLLKM